MALVVSVLGVLKAGGAYLPLDPSYPSERLAYMVDDAGAPVVVTQLALSQGRRWVTLVWCTWTVRGRGSVARAARGCRWSRSLGTWPT